VIENEILERILNINWFSNCGNSISIGTPIKVIHISNWTEATKYYSDSVWEDTTLEARNILTEFLHNKHMNDYRNWNKVTDEAKAFLENSIKPKIIKFKDENNLDKIFVDCVMWDLLGAIMEFYYRKCKDRPEFFGELLKIYENGNFPCGWEGKYPNGKLIVY
jgi:hypothetical protein